MTEVMNRMGDKVNLRKGEPSVDGSRSKVYLSTSPG